MSVKFTEEQQRAINTLDKSVLVSAAAGSGKTAVLVERIINIILSGKADVDEMLVVTFTKAAAAEMRLKLAKAIKKRMKEDPVHKGKLRQQLDRLYRSYICTFDSFAGRVIKEFFYEIDIEPSFKICDEVQSTLMKRDALDSLIDEAFVCDELIAGGSFRAFMRLYSKERSEEEFKTELINSYDKLRTLPDYRRWVFDKAENLKVSKEDFAKSEIAHIMMEEIEHAVQIALDAINGVKSLYVENGIESKFEQMLGNEYRTICILNEKVIVREFDDEFIRTFENLEWVNLQSYNRFFEENGDDERKKIYNGFKTQITPLRNIYKGKDGVLDKIRLKYFIPSFEQRLAEMNVTYEHTVYYLKLMQAFEEKYMKLKKESSLMDFADVNHVAVEILKKQEPSDTLRRRFKYIFIDEYQDTNNIQEYLIERFAREDNVFKVGDVKQSIYRFRQAEPSIFEKVYKDYSSDSNPNAVAIDLNRNFRSNNATINYINAVFENLMEGYDSRAKLYTGLQDEYDFEPELHLLSEESMEETEIDVGDADEEIENLTAEEAETRYIAETIRNLIGTKFCDTKTGEIREICARDVVILYRSVKARGDIMTRALRNVDVQAHVESDENYFDTVEIGIAMSIFSCIDNMKRDVPLIATLHSEAFNWTPAELAEVRAAHRKITTGKQAYWRALEWYASEGSSEEIRSKAEYAIEKIREWRELSNIMSTPDFIWKVLIDSGYYLRAGAMYDGDRRQANLRTLVDRARRYCEGTVASLNSFLRFVEIMKTRNISNGQATMVSKDDDVVKITTIHKSKGLEYPVVIVGGIGHNPRRGGNSGSFSFDSEYGIGLRYVSPDRRYYRDTLIQGAIKAKAELEEYKEALRVLYVAMTRARNKLILVGSAKSEESALKYTANPQSFLKIMREVIDTPFNKYVVCPLVCVDEKCGTSRICELLSSKPKTLSSETMTLYEEINRRLSYEYPDREMLTAPSKYSVSALRREELEESSSQTADTGADSDETALPRDDEIVTLWHISDNHRKAGATDKGIAYHRIMEFLDFSKVGMQVDLDYIEDCAHYLRDKGAIEEAVFEELDLSKIADFFKSDLGRRAVAAADTGSLKKEKAFTLQTDWKGRTILVQGVIDCCWEETGDGGSQMILIDYKSSFIDPRKPYEAEIERIRREYKTQIDLYKQAIEEGTGITVSEAYIYLFANSEAISML